MSTPSPLSLPATIPVSIINGLLAVAATAIFLLFGFLQSSSPSALVGPLLLGGFFAAGIILFYQSLKCALHRSTLFAPRLIFLSAGLHQLLSIALLVIYGIYLLYLNTQDPRSFHGDEMDLTPFATTCFALTLWPAYGTILFLCAYRKEASPQS